MNPTSLPEHFCLSVFAHTARLFAQIAQPLPAIAKSSSLASPSRDTAAEFENIVRSRGSSLPNLTSSPTLRAPEGSRASSPDGERSELLRELKRENEEISRLKQQLESTKQSTSTPMTKSTQQAAPVVTTPPPVQETRSTESEKGGGFSALNLLGIVGVGALGGYLTIVRKQADETETTLQGRLASERASVGSLRSQLEQVKAAVEHEKGLREALKREAAAASSDAARKLQLEKDAGEALAREKAMTERYLEAEKALTEAIRKESAATAEALEAEKAAKFAADAEARELQRMLNETNIALENERDLAKRIGIDAAKVKADFAAALDQQKALADQKASLEKSLASESERGDNLQATKDSLQAQLAAAEKESAKQAELVRNLSHNNNNLQSGLNDLKMQAARMADAAQTAAEKAASELEAAQNAYAQLQGELDGERNCVATLESELTATREQLHSRNEEARRLDAELQDSASMVAALRQEVAELSQLAVTTEEALMRESEAVGAAKQDAAQVRSDLASVQKELAEVHQSLSAERADRAEIAAALEELKAAYANVQDRMESEQNSVMSLQREMNDLRRIMSDVESTNASLSQEINKVQEDAASHVQAALGEAENAKNVASAERAAREDAVAAVAKLESIINMVRDEMVEAQVAADKAKAALEAEKCARVEAEESVVRLRTELDVIAEAEAAARSAAEGQLAQLKSEFESAREKLDLLQATKPKRTRTKSATPADVSTNGDNDGVKAAPKPRRTRAKKDVEAEIPVANE